MDLHIWYTLLSAIIGGVMGARARLGEVCLFFRVFSYFYTVHASSFFYIFSEVNCLIFLFFLGDRYVQLKWCTNVLRASLKSLLRILFLCKQKGTWMWYLDALSSLTEERPLLRTENSFLALLRPVKHVLVV